MNQHYKKLAAIIASLTDEATHWSAWLETAMREAGTPVSKSRLHGWGLSPQHKNYRPISADELLDVMNAIYAKLNNHPEP